MGNTAVRRRRAGLAAGIASLAMALGFTAIPADAAPPPRVDYVALGDSYTAGTGADTRGRIATAPFSPAFPCDQTAGGYVDVVDNTASVNLVANAACHGALLNMTAQPGDVPSIYRQVAALVSSKVLSEQTDLVSMTAGANDVGVNTVLFTCATSSAAACAEAVQSAADAMPKVEARLVHAFAAIHRQAPNAQILILGYPRLFNPAGAPLMSMESQLLVNQGTALLNATIQRAAAAANAKYGSDVQYVDVTARFFGHEVNTLEPWIFFAAAPDATGALQFDQRSFHPNAEGHAAYAAALTEAANLSEFALR